MRDEPTRFESESGARRRNRRTLRAAVPGRNVSGKSFVADGRINERCASGENSRDTGGAEDATLLVRSGHRLVMVAIGRRGFRFHDRATIGLFDRWRRQRLRWKRRDRERGRDRNPSQESQGRSHNASILPAHRIQGNPGLEKVARPNVRLSGAVELKKMRGRCDRITFSCDLSACYNPFPIMEPVVRETKFC